jgi:hypothetical protein
VEAETAGIRHLLGRGYVLCMTPGLVHVSAAHTSLLYPGIVCKHKSHILTQKQNTANVRCPWSSVLAKQLSVILRRSSSNRSARDVAEGVELVAEGAPLEPPVFGRFGGARGSAAPLV